MIHIENISKSFHGENLFFDAKIVIKKGMRIGLVGANGSGKTTLLRMILDEEKPDSGSINIDTVVIETTKLFGLINWSINALPNVIGFFIGVPSTFFEKDIK